MRQPHQDTPLFAVAGLSVVTAIFDDRPPQLVAEILFEGGTQLPDGVPPRMTPLAAAQVDC